MRYSEKEIEKRAKLDFKLNKEIIAAFKRKPPKNLDELFQSAHDKAFKKINCLDCGNCCRSLGPRLNAADIERLAKYLRMKTAGFIDSYLRVDEDGDHVFKEMPCPFLGSDNKCSVYEHRPRACKEYPHTDRKKMDHVLDLTLKNTYVCPAVTDILSDLRIWKAQNRKD